MPALFIITGVSRGIGAALAKAAVEAGHAVVGLGRSPAAHGLHLAVDLCCPQSAAERLEEALSLPQARQAERIALINNAATLEPVGARFDAEAVQAHFAVNLLSPILLSRRFVDLMRERPQPARIIQISSGAADSPHRGWSLYCAGKAGLEQFSRCLALEQADTARPVDVLCLRPGVVDTPMQAQIRDRSRDDFPDVQRFRELAQSGQLAAPAEVAEALLAAALSARRYAGATLRRHQLP